MASYLVTSPNFVPFPEGTVVDDAQLVGCDVAALVCAGHLTPLEGPVAPPAPASEDLAAAQAELAKAEADLAAAQAAKQPPADAPVPDPSPTADPAAPPKE